MEAIRFEADRLYLPDQTRPLLQGARLTAYELDHRQHGRFPHGQGDDRPGGGL